MKTGVLKTKDPVEIVADQQLKLVTDAQIEGDATKMGVSYKQLNKMVKVGSNISIGDGTLSAEVCEIGDDYITVTCKNSCKLAGK